MVRILPHAQACLRLVTGLRAAQPVVGTEDDETYVWIRRFESDQQLATFNEAYYGTDEWKNELEPRVKEMLDFPSMKVTRLEATPKSVIR